MSSKTPNACVMRPTACARCSSPSSPRTPMKSCAPVSPVRPVSRTCCGICASLHVGGDVHHRNGAPPQHDGGGERVAVPGQEDTLQRRQACLEVLGENQPAGRTHVRRARLVRRARMAALGAFLVHTLNIARARACRLARDGKPYREANNNRSNTKTQSAKKRAKHGVRMASPLAPPPPDSTLGAVLGGLGFG